MIQAIIRITFLTYMASRSPANSTVVIIDSKHLLRSRCALKDRFPSAPVTEEILMKSALADLVRWYKTSFSAGSFILGMYLTLFLVSIVIQFFPRGTRAYPAPSTYPADYSPDEPTVSVKSKDAR